MGNEREMGERHQGAAILMDHVRVSLEGVVYAFGEWIVFGLVSIEQRGLMGGDGEGGVGMRGM